MAVCNLFNELTSRSGNFMLFSQYVEDITHNQVEGDNYKVVPTKFVALDIDYSRIDVQAVLPDGDNLNIGIPKYFQNYFENSCAYCRNLAQTQPDLIKWTPEISRNLFWNSMFFGNFLHTKPYKDENDKNQYVPEIVYYGDINMHSYNEHKGMGYGEIYCYIPTSAEQVNCQVVIDKNTDDGEGDEVDMGGLTVTNNNLYLEGHKIEIGKYNKTYKYNKYYNMSFDSDDIEDFSKSTNSKYKINTIVVLYSIFRKINDNWNVMYSDIPMGMYFNGKFDNYKLTNEATKYVSTSYDTGTSYGLRICTRFSVMPNGRINSDSDITTDNSGYSNLCQVMTAMSENLSQMMKISNDSTNYIQQLKDTLSTLKNNRSNVPYVKEINGVDYWFVNGRFVSKVASSGAGSSCVEISNESLEKRLENISDAVENNDYAPVYDDTNDCEELTAKDVAEYLGLETTETVKNVVEIEKDDIITDEEGNISVEIDSDKDIYPDTNKIEVTYNVDSDIVSEEELNDAFCTAEPECPVHNDDWKEDWEGFDDYCACDETESAE